MPSTPTTARLARRIARTSIGLNARLDRIRLDIRTRRAVIAALAAAGTPAQPYARCDTDAEFRMDRAVTNLRISKQRYAEAVADFVIRAPLPLPGGRPVPTEPVRVDPALARDIVTRLSANGFVSIASLAAHFGVGRHRITAALDAIEASGIRLHRRHGADGGAEIDQIAADAAQPAVAVTDLRRVLSEPWPPNPIVRAATGIAGIPVRAVPGQRGFYGAYRGPKTRRGTASLEQVAARLAEMGVQIGSAV